jgi:hypothetical protein
LKQHEARNGKAELPEAQVLTDLHLSVTYGSLRKHGSCGVMAHD